MGKFLIILIIAVVAVSFFIYRGRTDDAMEGELVKEDTNVESEIKQWEFPPDMEIDQHKEHVATMKTSKGEIKIKLYASETPFTVNNFVFLSRQGFYDNTKFHRVIKDFMIQGGDPTGTGKGGPGYTFNDEPIIRDYTRGTLAMANAGPNTNGSQFFIMHQELPLPKSYVIFGEVIEGMDVVDKIANTEVKASPFGELSSPVEDITIKSIKIEEKND
jgi:cyclophilin family peptidyl-prolyl cis-trans isomerase